MPEVRGLVPSQARVGWHGAVLLRYLSGDALMALTPEEKRERKNARQRAQYAAKKPPKLPPPDRLHSCPVCGIWHAYGIFCSTACRREARAATAEARAGSAR